MGSIRKRVSLAAPLDEVWSAVRDFGAVHERLVPGFAVSTKLDGTDRIVTFASGAVQREPLVVLDDERHRLVYTAVDSVLGATHYNAAVEVQAADSGSGTTLDWVVDFLPDDISDRLDAAMDMGAAAMRATLT